MPRVFFRGNIQVLQVVSEVVGCTSIRVPIFFWRKIRRRIIGLSRLIWSSWWSSKSWIGALIAPGGSVPDFPTKLTDGT
jgi:hypothetical protein